MGVSFSSTGGPKKGESVYAISPALQTEILEDRWRDLLIQKKNPYFELIDVDLSTSTYSNPWRHEYRAATNSEIQHDCPLVIVFPHHTDVKKQVLWTSSYRSMASLNGDIVDRLPSFKAGTGNTQLMDVRIALFMDNRVIRVRGSIGTLHLVWLAKFNQVSRNSQTSEVLCNVPSLVEKNGEGAYRNLVVLTQEAGRKGKKLESIDLYNLVLEEDTENPIYVREDDPRKHHKKNPSLKMKTQAQAMEFVTKSGMEDELVQDTKGVPVFTNQGDSDEDILVLAGDTLIDGKGALMEMELVTPRHVKPQMTFDAESDEDQDQVNNSNI